MLRRIFVYGNESASLSIGRRKRPSANVASAAAESQSVNISCIGFSKI